MQHFALALTTLATTVAIAPYAYATPNFDELRQTTSGQNIVGADHLQTGAAAADALAVTPIDTADFNELRRETLENTAVTLSQITPENAAQDSVLELIVIDL